VQCEGHASGKNQLAHLAATYTDLGGRFEQTCGVDTYGVLHCWGTPSEVDRSQAQPAPRRAHPQKVDASTHYPCGLSVAGDVVFWYEPESPGFYG